MLTQIYVAIWRHLFTKYVVMFMSRIINVNKIKVRYNRAVFVRLLNMIVASNECHNVWNYLQLGSLFNNLFGSASKISSKHHIASVESMQKSHLFNQLYPLRWRHNDGDSVSNHQPHDCLLSCLFGRTSKKTSKLRVTGLCVGNSPGTGEFPAQMASNAENVSIWWRHHAKEQPCNLTWWCSCFDSGQWYWQQEVCLMQILMQRHHDSNTEFSLPCPCCINCLRNLHRMLTFQSSTLKGSLH